MALFDPTKGAAGKTGRKQLAPRRFTTLDGVRLGLVSNSKLNADKVLLALGDLLAERYTLKSVVHEHKQNFSLPAPDSVVNSVAAQSDVVICGVGD